MRTCEFFWFNITALWAMMFKNLIPTYYFVKITELHCPYFKTSVIFRFFFLIILKDQIIENKNAKIGWVGWVKDQCIENNNPKSDGGTVWGGAMLGSKREMKLSLSAWGRGDLRLVLINLSLKH